MGTPFRKWMTDALWFALPAGVAMSVLMGYGVLIGVYAAGLVLGLALVAWVCAWLVQRLTSHYRRDVGS